MNSFAKVHSAVSIIIPKKMPTSGTDAMVKILSNMNVVFSLIGSAVMSPEFAQARDFGNALVSKNDTGPASRPTVGNGVGDAPLEDPNRKPPSDSEDGLMNVAPTDLWIEALKAPAGPPSHQSLHEAVAGMPRIPAESKHLSFRVARSWQLSLSRDERAMIPVVPVMTRPLNLEMPSIVHLSGATMSFPAGFDY